METSQHKSDPKVIPPAYHRKTKNIHYAKTLVAAILLVGLSGSVGYYIGFKKGKTEGGEAAIRKITEAINPLNLIANNPVLPGTVIGQVTAVGNNVLTVKQVNGQEKQISLSENIQVTQQSNTLDISAVKQGSQVTVFVKKEGSKELATRIIVR